MYEFVTKFWLAGTAAMIIVITPSAFGYYSTMPSPAYLFLGVFMGTLLGMIPSREWKRINRPA